MRYVMALVVVASVAAAQARSNAEPTYQLRVKASDTTQHATMTIEWSAPRIFTAIGGVPGVNSGVSVGPSGGSGNGTVVVTLSKGPGRLTFTAMTAPELELTLMRSDGSAMPRQVARGRVVAVAATADGEYSVSSRP